MVRVRAPYAARTTVAVALACALLLFTTVYRHSSGFSPATAARCHSLSTDRAEASGLFAGAFGPLAVLRGPLVLPAPAVDPDITPVEHLVASERRLALIVTPFHRPPPSRVA